MQCPLVELLAYLTLEALRMKYLQVELLAYLTLEALRMKYLQVELLAYLTLEALRMQCPLVDLDHLPGDGLVTAPAALRKCLTP